MKGTNHSFRTKKHEYAPKRVAVEIQKKPVAYRQRLEQWLNAEDREHVSDQIREAYEEIVESDDTDAAIAYAESLAFYMRHTTDPLHALVAESYVVALDQQFTLDIAESVYAHGLNTYRKYNKELYGMSGNSFSDIEVVDKIRSETGTNGIIGSGYRFIDGTPEVLRYNDGPLGIVQNRDTQFWEPAEVLIDDKRYADLQDNPPFNARSEYRALLQPEVLEYCMREFGIQSFYPESILQLAEYFQTASFEQVDWLLDLMHFLNNNDHAGSWIDSMPGHAIDLYFNIFRSVDIQRTLYQLIKTQDTTQVGSLITTYKSVREHIEHAIQRTDALMGNEVLEHSENHSEFMRIVLRRSEKYLKAQGDMLLHTSVPFESIYRGLIEIPFELILLSSYREWLQMYPDAGPVPRTDYRSIDAGSILRERPHFLQDMQALYYLGWPTKQHIPDAFVQMMDEAAADDEKAAQLEFYCALESFLPEKRKSEARDTEKDKFVSSFLYVKEVGENEVYVGGSNTRSIAAGQAMSVELVRRVLEDYSEYTIHAEADSFSRTLRSHLENIGSVATACVVESSDRNGQTEAYFNTEKKPDSNPRVIRLPHREYRSKQLSELYAHDYEGRSLEELRGRPVILRAYNKAQGGETLLAHEATQLLNVDGYMMTRIICLDDRKTCDTQLVAFELPVEQSQAA